MIFGKKIVVVLPAYNAEKTLLKTYEGIPREYIDEIILVDDYSRDRTVEAAEKLKIPFIIHDKNLGYGGNQKTCYIEALKRGADIVVMLHPDSQYPPQLVFPMASLIASGMFDVVLGSRILAGHAIEGGMPLYKFIANRVLTAVQNIFLGQKLSEYHTGYRAFSREVLLNLPLLENSNDFIFDNQMLAQTIYFKYRIGEISSPCFYEKNSSSISFRRSIIYGCGVLSTCIKFIFQRQKWMEFPIFQKDGKRLPLSN